MTDVDLSNPKIFEFVQNELNARAKLFWWIARLCEFIVLLIGVVTTVIDLSPFLLFIVASIVTISWYGTQWRSDYIKGQGQYYLRKFEYWDGLDWMPDEKELRDIHVTIPNFIRKKIVRFQTKANYFASQTPTSFHRLIENLEESSWWSKNLADSAFRLFLGVSGILFAIAFIILLVALQLETPNQAIEEKIVRIVISIFVFVFSAGYLRTAFEHKHFSSASADVEYDANHLLKIAKKLNQTQALVLLHKYQIARESAPLIPTFIWRIQNSTLDEGWKKYKQQ